MAGPQKIQYRVNPRGELLRREQPSPTERILGAGTGLGLAVTGLRRGSLLLAAAGAGLAYLANSPRTIRVARPGQGESARAQPADEVEQASMESFPASDAPGQRVESRG